MLKKMMKTHNTFSCSAKLGCMLRLLFNFFKISTKDKILMVRVFEGAFEGVEGQSNPTNKFI